MKIYFKSTTARSQLWPGRPSGLPPEGRKGHLRGEDGANHGVGAGKPGMKEKEFNFRFLINFSFLLDQRLQPDHQHAGKAPGIARSCNKGFFC